MNFTNEAILEDENLHIMGRPQPLPTPSSECASIDDPNNPNHHDRVTKCSSLKPCQYNNQPEDSMCDIYERCAVWDNNQVA